ncbi:unnamed protein product [Sympodiomycopsis kandeliae]
MKFVFSATIIAGTVALSRNAVRAQGVINSDDANVTPADNLVLALLNTNQTEGVPADAYPAEPVDATEVATNTSQVLDAPARRWFEPARRWFEPVAVRGINKGNVATRNILSARDRTYQVIYDGTDPANSAFAGAAVQAPAYLTYKVVSNTTSYAASKADCLAFCTKTPSCASANLYYEFDNPLLDWVFSEKSNLKCALYGEIPTTNQMTNKGGQQLKPKGYPLNHIEKSSVFATTDPLDNVATPAGYELTYGPVNAANNDPTYMTYKFLTQYDPTACGKICSSTPGCVSFNIWRGVVAGDPRTYTCSLYRGVVTQDTAKNTGDAVNKVVVTYSRGYKNTAAANALAQCQSSGAAQGVAWSYIPKSDAETYQCGTNGGDVPAPGSASTANGLTTNGHLSATGNQFNDPSFNPYDGPTSVSTHNFVLTNKFYFKAPQTGKYTFTVSAADDVVRAWFGNKAKSGWTAANSDLLATCASAQQSTQSFQLTLNAGSYTPARVAWLQGNGPYGFDFVVTDASGNTVDNSNFVQYACDQTVSAFNF